MLEYFLKNIEYLRNKNNPTLAVAGVIQPITDIVTQLALLKKREKLRNASVSNNNTVYQSPSNSKNFQDLRVEKMTTRELLYSANLKR